MQANFVKETVSAGGVGALTLSGKVVSFIDFNAAVGVDKYFNYLIEDGNDREVGIGHITTSTNFVRDTVIETLVSGTLDRTSPSAINVTTAAEVGIAATAEGKGMHRPGAFLGSFAGMGTGSLSNDTDSSETVILDYLYMLPFRWDSSQQIDSIAMTVDTAVALGEAHFAMYEIEADGGPGNRLINFTETTTIDCSTTGLKSQAADAPYYLPAGDYYLGFVVNSSTIRFKAPQYAGHFTFLGPTSAGLQAGNSFRVYTFAACPADESGQTYTPSTNDTWVTTWIK